MRSKFTLIVLAFALVGGALVIYQFPPHANAFYPKCIFKKMTSLECPGCGSARAVYSLLHGDFIKAADYNILLLILLPAVCIGLIASFSNHLHGLWHQLNKPTLYFILIAVFWILRNINYFPFSILHSDK